MNLPVGARHDDDGYGLFSTPVEYSATQHSLDLDLCYAIAGLVTTRAALVLEGHRASDTD